LAGLVVLLLAAGGAVVYVTTDGGSTNLNCSKGVSCGTNQANPPVTDPSAHTLTVRSTTPSTGATGVVSNTTVSVRFSSPVGSASPDPTLSPSISGNWSRSSADEMVFDPTAPFVPFTKYTLTIPGGRHGIVAVDGAHLASGKTISFTIADGSVLRLQQLLAELGYLPLSYSEPSVPPQDMTLPQSGTLAWRWSGLPQEWTDQWVQGSTNLLTKGAVMTFETENGLTVDGIAGTDVWSALLADVASGKTNTEAVTYVLVTKTEPEHLTAWVNGSLAFHDILVNTGVPGAPTTDGTFEVFEHVKASHMSGTDVTGTKYTITTVPWASYFDGGEALHGFPRAAYGFPQSNGCVEMRITTAGRLWPYTIIGTLVTVVGPPASN
jgi:peptidoglycan hydrolase-like protein with peptidoglycan-binding domain